MALSPTANQPVPNPFLGTQPTNYTRRNRTASAAPPGPPAPTGLTAMRDVQDTAFIDWTNPSTGSPFLSIEVTTTPVTTTQTHPYLGGTEYTLDPYPYVAGQAYVFHLAMVNAAGKGAVADSPPAVINP
jgi:hypothetical protein